MSLQRQQHQLHQLVNQGTKSSINQNQSTVKLSISLNPVGQYLTPSHKSHQSQGNESGLIKKQKNFQSMDFGLVKTKKVQQTKSITNNHFQMELLKLMTKNTHQDITGQQNQKYLNDTQLEALNNVRKVMTESVRGITPKQNQSSSLLNLSKAHSPCISYENILEQFAEENRKKKKLISNYSQEKKIPTSPSNYMSEKKTPFSTISMRTSVNHSKQNNSSLIGLVNNTMKTSQKRFFSNDRKQNGYSQSTDMDYDNQDVFTVVLHHEQQKYEFKIDANKTTDWLEMFLTNEIHKISVHQSSTSGSQQNILKRQQNATEQTRSSQYTQVVAIISFDKNLPLDYYLQLKDRSLMIFKNQSLNLQPLFNEDENPEPHQVNLADFKFHKCIGVGGFSRVYLVKKKSTGRIFAMKLIDKEFIIKNKKQGIVQNERDIMTVLDHPFISKLEHSFESHNFVVFILEFCSGGELFWQLRQVKRMREDQAKFYFTEICLGMLYLHSLDVVYRDIKPENILIDVDGHIRIADFGLSKPNMGRDDYAYSFCGSPEYMAPEMLLKTGHNVQVDHYCLGALLYELVTGLPPYYSRDTNQIYESILNEELTFPEQLNLSHDIKSLLSGLLNKDPEFRLGSKGGLQQMMKHPWFKGINFVDILDKQVPPPFTLNQLKFNFDSSELTKGELETREKLIGKTGLTQKVTLFESFYFDQNEQKLMKQEQKKIFQQHRSQVAQQQAIIQARGQTVRTLKIISLQEAKLNGLLKKTKPESNMKPQSSTELLKGPSKMYQQSQIQQKTPYQKTLNVPSPTYQNKINLGIRRITAQNNFFQDNQFNNGISGMDNSVAESSILGLRSIGTEQSEKLSAQPKRLITHKKK